MDDAGARTTPCGLLQGARVVFFLAGARDAELFVRSIELARAARRSTAAATICGWSRT